jgi:hypothetical protein
MAKFLIPLAAALGLIFWMAHLAAGVAVCVVITGYLVSLYVHPERDCISCHGHKTHGPEGSANFRFCLTCKGKGRYPRLGVRVFRRDVIRGLKAGRRGRFWG